METVKNAVNRKKAATTIGNSPIIPSPDAMARTTTRIVKTMSADTNAVCGFSDYVVERINPAELPIQIAPLGPVAVSFPAG